MDMLLLPGTELPAWAEPLEFGETVITDTLSAREYHDTRALVSKGGLDEAARSLEHYAHYLKHGTDAVAVPTREKEKEAFIVGRAAHSLVLEPGVFGNDFVRLPDFGKMQSSRNRTHRDEWLRNEHPGKTPLKEWQWLTVHAMRESVYRHRRVRKLLEGGRPEVTCAALCDKTGLPRKVRWDWVSEIESEGVDLKSARDANPAVWVREAIRRRYHVQDPYYVSTGKLAGLDIENMSFVVVEKTAPYSCVLIHLPPDALLAGELTYMHQMRQIAHAAETGVFPGYGDGEIVTVDFPKYVLTQAESLPLP